MWYLYVLQCNDASFYTGITNDVPRRLAEHQAGRGARYTRIRLPVRLLAAWRYPDRSAATQAEAAFKKLRRAAKQSRVESRRPFLGAPFAFEVLDDPQPQRFCMRCGGPLEIHIRDAEPLWVCTLCGWRHYRNAKPCAGALILRDGCVLLIRRDREPYTGFWDIPGGFLRADELPQDGAIREAREETGLDVQIVALLGFYLDSYVYQGEHSPTLNIYFVTTATGEPVVGDEADAFRWFPLDALPEQIAFAHAPQVLADLRTWLEGQ